MALPVNGSAHLIPAYCSSIDPETTKKTYRKVKAKFHYTGPTGSARTLSETRTDPTEFLGDPGRKKARSGPRGSGRARVVEFSYYAAPIVGTAASAASQT